MMASPDSEDDSFGVFSLTEEEIAIPPWQQMLRNGAIDPSCVMISDSADASCTTQESVGEREGYFSGESDDDEEEEAVHDNSNLELRDYQKELAADALQGKNTIIWAPTGSGKTRVATYIISEHLRVPDGRNKKVAFLARTVPLALQQYKSLLKYLPNYEITLITGDSGNNMSLCLLLPYNDIVVMTPMILENHLTRKLLSDLGEFSMLVFDECHHTRKGEPYNTLMSFYFKSKQELDEAEKSGRTLNIRLPQIVGLTASIGIERAGSLADAQSSILKVCGNLDVAKISTVKRHKDELSSIVPIPTELTRRLNKRRGDVTVLKIIEIMQELERHMANHIKELNRGQLSRLTCPRPEDRKSQEYEQWAVHRRQDAVTVPLGTTDSRGDLSVRLIIKIAQYLQGYRFSLEIYDLVELRDVMDYLDKCFQDLQVHQDRTPEENAFYEYFIGLKNFVLNEPSVGNPNLQILAETLMEYLINKGETSRGIIFVRTRALAQALVSWLNRCEIQDLRNLNACTFTGSNISEEKGGMSQAKQDSIMQMFRSGDVRLIVATSVAEEGIDIPECNLVVKYNHAGNEVTVIQTRGRSRAFGGVSILLAMDSVLERELINKGRAELMWQAIESIIDLEPATFEAKVRIHQQELLETARIAEEAKNIVKERNKNVPFKIVCPMCRKVLVENTNMRTIYEKYRISVDRNLLNQILVLPYSEPEPMDGLFFVGRVLCKCETSPGNVCHNPLGPMIKHKGIPMVHLGIQNIAFDLGNQTELRTFKQWKKAPFTIDELTYDDIKRYLTETNVLARALSNSTNDSEADEDSSGDENI